MSDRSKLDSLADEHATAAEAEQRARERLYDEVRRAVLDDRMTESEAARRSGLNRMTVRKILGKR